MLLLSNTPGEKQAVKKKARRGREPHYSLVPSSIGSKIPASKTWQGSLCTTLARYEKILYKNSFTKIYKFFLKSKPSSIGSKIPASKHGKGPWVPPWLGMTKSFIKISSPKSKNSFQNKIPSQNLKSGSTEVFKRYSNKTGWRINL